jgi:uncharacterized protein (UPF0216 family)
MAKVRFQADRPYEHLDERQLKGVIRRTKEHIEGRKKQLDELLREKRIRGLT